MTGYDPHEDCARCTNCAQHLTPQDQWPCLQCHRNLCASCECPGLHVMEPCS